METVVKKATIHTATLCVILLAALGGLVYFASEMVERQALVIETKERLASYEQNKRAFAEESIKLKEIAGRIDVYKQDAVTIDSVPQFLSAIEATAIAYDIDFTITAAETTGEDGSQKELFVDIAAEGDVDRIISFSNDILRKRYQAQFTRFSLFQEEVQKAADGTIVPQAGPYSWSLLARIKVVTL